MVFAGECGVAAVCARRWCDARCVTCDV
jgi:hypothetical protein